MSAGDIHTRDADKRIAYLEVQAEEDADTIIKLTKKYVELEQELSTLRSAAKKSMKGCVRCRGKVKFRGKDLEVWVCNYCEDLTAAIKEEEGK